DELGLEPARLKRLVVEPLQLRGALGDLRLELPRPGEPALGTILLVTDPAEDMPVEERDHVEEDDAEYLARAPHEGGRSEVDVRRAHERAPEQEKRQRLPEHREEE